MLCGQYKLIQVCFVVSTESYRCISWSVQTHTGMLCGQYKLTQVCFIVKTRTGALCGQYKLKQVCFIVKTRTGVLCGQYRLVQVFCISGVAFVFVSISGIYLSKQQSVKSNIL